MEAVKESIARGTPTAMAIRGELLGRGLTIAAFAEKYDLARQGITGAISGSVRPTDEMIEALVHELGGTAEAWRELLWLAAKPPHVGKVRIAG